MQRRKEIAIRPPAHIHELVERAGRENVFWTTARRPGKRPTIGGGASELRNSVVGSDLTATQGAPSAQPIWRGTRYEFAGDDYLELGPVATSFQGVTYVATVKLRAGEAGNGYYFVHLDDSTTDARIFLRYDATNQIYEGEVFDESGSFATFAGGGISDGGDQIGGWAVVGLSVAPDGGFVFRASGGLSADRPPPGGTITSFDSALLHARRPSSPTQFWVGDTREILVARQDVSGAYLESLVESAAQHWRIL